MPRTRAESMISGSIVITTPYHDIDKFIKNGENGFIINNATEVDQIFRSLIDDKVLRKNLSIATYETALDNFSQEKYLSFWVDLIFKRIS
jgi:glycosyltransferase involved in cell wall biosynthesis